mmetsp:Transcript_27/g.55  ORF Transcript_27/g.55 Transcript_27/m.55 type:complete len:353 (-) Transcript_27:45-1103(-)
MGRPLVQKGHQLVRLAPRELSRHVVNVLNRPRVEDAVHEEDGRGDVLVSLLREEALPLLPRALVGHAARAQARGHVLHPGHVAHDAFEPGHAAEGGRPGEEAGEGDHLEVRLWRERAGDGVGVEDGGQGAGRAPGQEHPVGVLEALGLPEVAQDVGEDLAPAEVEWLPLDHHAAVQIPREAGAVAVRELDDVPVVERVDRRVRADHGEHERGGFVGGPRRGAAEDGEGPLEAGVLVVAPAPAVDEEEEGRGPAPAPGSKVVPGRGAVQTRRAVLGRVREQLQVEPGVPVSWAQPPEGRANRVPQFFLQQVAQVSDALGQRLQGRADVQERRRRDERDQQARLRPRPRPERHP